MSEICAICGSVLTETVLGRQCPVCVFAFSLAGAAPDTPAGARAFGHYELLEELGRGGMGVVYRAWEPRLERAVALKLLLAGPFASEGFAARFQREARLAARLRHPHIVAVHDAGEAEGQPFYTMELVEGSSLSSLVREGPLDTARAAGCLRLVAEAVEHAHRQGVLHCDLKPSNILLTADDQPKIADFGLARLWREAPEVTVEGAALGSPSFMAPEQAEGRREDIGPATDVYALGAVLYHMLTGRPPHQGGSVGEVLAQVRAAPVVSPRLLNPSTPRDLETICLKCLDKEPRRRYPTAAALAEDLARFQRGEVVRARPVHALEKAWRWARRNRALAAALAGLAAVCLTGAGAVLWQMRRNQLERERLELESYATGIKAASIAAAEGDFPLARSYLAALRPPPRRPDWRGFEWRYLWAATASEEKRRWRPHTSQITGLAFSPDGRRLVTTSSLNDNTVISDLDDAWNLSPRWRGEGFGWGPVFSPEGDLFLASRGRVRLLAAPEWSPVWETPGHQTSLSADGARLAVVKGVPFFWESVHATAEVWDVTRRQRLIEPAVPARTAALSPDGRRLALADAEGRIRLWDVDADREVLSLPTAGRQHALAFSPDGRWLAACGRGATSLWDLSREPVAVRHLEHPWLTVWAVAFAPDSSRLATTCSDRGVRLWDTDSGRLLRTFHGHADEVWSAAFHPDGRHLATGSKDGSLFLWFCGEADAPARKILPHTAWRAPLFSPADNLVTGFVIEDGQPRAVRETRDGGEAPGPAGWRPCGYSREGDRLLLWGSETPPLRWWNVRTQAFGEAFAEAEPYDRHFQFQAGVSEDRTCVYQLQKDGRLLVWDAATGRQRRALKLPAPQHDAAGLALFGDRRALLSRTGPRHAWLIDLESNRVHELHGHTQELKGVALSPDGALAATASSDGAVRVWDAATGAALHTLLTHPESTADVVFSPDGRTLAAVGVHQSISFWHLATGRELLTIPMPDAGSFLEFSPDGHRLAVTRELEDADSQAGLILIDAPPVDDDGVSARDR